MNAKNIIVDDNQNRQPLWFGRARTMTKKSLPKVAMDRDNAGNEEKIDRRTMS